MSATRTPTRRTFPPYRLDRYATKADRRTGGRHTAAPAHGVQVLGPAPTQHWVPFVAADGHVYRERTERVRRPAARVAVGRRVVAAEQRDLRRHRCSTARAPPTSTSGPQRRTPRSAAPSSWPARWSRFRSWASAATSAQRAPGGRPAAGQRAGRVHRGVRDQGRLRARPADAGRRAETELAVSGSLWWSASNWRNRISVPLTFAVPDNACDVVSSSNDVDIYGSELLIQATGQWAPHFCLNPKLFKFTHVQTGEPEARNLLATGGAEAAFTSDPPAGGYRQAGRERAGCGERLRDHLRDRRSERAAVHQAAPRPAAARQAAHRVLPRRAAGPAGGPGARAQPARHHPRPGVPEAQPGHHTRRQRLDLGARRCWRCPATPTSSRRSPPTSTTTRRREHGSTASPTSGAWWSTRRTRASSCRWSKWPLLSDVRAEGVLRLRQQRLPAQQPGAVPAARRRAAGAPRGDRRVDAVLGRPLDDRLLADRRHDARREARRAWPPDRRLSLHARASPRSPTPTATSSTRPRCRPRARTPSCVPSDTSMRTAVAFLKPDKKTGTWPVPY